MSWSRSYKGTPADVAAQAAGDRESVKKAVTELEHAQVDAAFDGIAEAMKKVPTGAECSVSTFGHGYRGHDGYQTGEFSVAVSFTVAAVEGNTQAE